ncbi:MAG: HAD family phosphatase [Spirochaetales bacterium]|jgi:HAD superfamily hydrolase (TIGR01509 family)|nr:HAD family phosphatase [Spirochaetales bacterium]
MSGMETFPFSAVIFDLDGTLIDSEKNYVKSDGQILTKFGIEYTPELRKRLIGRGIDIFVAILRDEYGVRETPETLLAMKDEYYLNIARTNTRVFPEMRGLLDILKARGVPLAVASGSSQRVVDELLALCGISSYFKVALSSVGLFQGKPDPGIFLGTADRLHVPARECLVLEDSASGVEAGLAAGMKVIAIPTLTKPPLDPVFEKAALLFPDGIDGFTAQAVLRFCEDQQT